MKRIFLGSLLALSIFGANGQDKKEEPKPTVTIGGFVRADYIWDSRKSASVREDHLNLYPLNVSKDANGKDVNAVSQSNFHSIVSRVNLRIVGPNALGAKTSAFVEGDFFGNAEGLIGLFRLRHANVTLDWGKSKLLTGQSWYPQFIPECFPGVANFSTGILFNPFGWVPQVKYTAVIGKSATLALTAYKDREFTAVSPSGVANEAVVNSPIPTLHANLSTKSDKFLAGIGAEYRSLKPRTIVTSGTSTYMNTTNVNSVSINAYAKFTGTKATVKAYGIMGQNTTQLVMLGGYLAQVGANGAETYVPLKTNAVWVEIMSNNAKVAPALFFGYTKNAGAKEDGTKAYARGVAVNGATVKDVWRTSARIDFKSGKFRISPELEYTAANWGTGDSKGAVTGATTNVGNVRFLMSTVLTF